VPCVIGLLLLLLEGDERGKEAADGGGKRLFGSWFLVALRRAGGGAMPEKIWTGMRKGRTIT
jgi:hypothetical protein